MYISQLAAYISSTRSILFTQMMYINKYGIPYGKVSSK